MKAPRRRLHPGQQAVRDSKKKRKILVPGRRWGKTTFAADDASEDFSDGKRVLYAAPTQGQTEKFWYEITRTFHEPIKRGLLYAHNTQHYIEVKGTEQRIQAKTAWNANTLRGGYADKLILDEYHLMNEDVWGVVGAPMLMDNGGSALFIYTPPALHTQLSSKARDKMHATKFRKEKEKLDEWDIFHGTSYDNPYLSRAAIAEAKVDMDETSFKMEILAQDLEESPHALWKKKLIRYKRINLDQMRKIVVGVDPSDYTKNSEVGIIVIGLGRDGNIYVINDCSVRFKKTEDWAEAVRETYYRYNANLVIAETNFGGDMVRHTMKVTDPKVRVKVVRASEGKDARAEPAVKLYRQGRVYHFKPMVDLEAQMTFWVPKSRMPSPDRMDAAVWGIRHFERPHSIGVLAA